MEPTQAESAPTWPDEQPRGRKRRRIGAGGGAAVRSSTRPHDKARRAARAAAASRAAAAAAALVQAVAVKGPGGCGVSPGAANLHSAVRRARSKAHGAVWDHSREALIAVLAGGSPLGCAAAAQVLRVLSRGAPARLAALTSSLKVLVRLTCGQCPTGCRAAAVALIQLVTTGDGGRSRALAAVGGIGPIVQLAQAGSHYKDRQLAVQVLCDLSADPAHRDAIGERGVEVLVAALHSSHRSAAVASRALAFLCEANEPRSAAAAAAGGIERLMRLLRGTTTPSGREASRQALDSLASSPERMARIAAAQVVETRHAAGGAHPAGGAD